MISNQKITESKSFYELGFFWLFIILFWIKNFIGLSLVCAENRLDVHIQTTKMAIKNPLLPRMRYPIELASYLRRIIRNERARSSFINKSLVRWAHHSGQQRIINACFIAKFIHIISESCSFSSRIGLYSVEILSQSGSVYCL